MIGHDLLGRRPSDTNSYLTADRAGPASARVWEWGWVRKNFSKKKKTPTDHQLAQAGTNWPPEKTHSISTTQMLDQKGEVVGRKVKKRILKDE